MITQTQKNLIEERVSEVEDIHNRQTLRKTLTRLFDKEEKGNSAFYELEDMWGFTGDYSVSDWGNEVLN